MKPSRLAGRAWPWALCLSVLISQGAAGQQDFINRREEARRATLATPQGLYVHYCAHCHGDDATGGGRLWASELSPPPADLTTIAIDRTALVAAIRDGSAAHGKSNLCPPWGRTIALPDIERLASYIASLQSSKTSTAPAAAGAPPPPAREPFPWLLAGFLLAEVGLLWWLPRRK